MMPEINIFDNVKTLEQSQVIILSENSKFVSLK